MITKKIIPISIILILCAVYISKSQEAIISIDTARDIWIAEQIINKNQFPTEGPILASHFNLGPIWYYFIAFLKKITPDSTALIEIIYILGSIQFPLAYAVGKRIHDSSSGTLLAALISLPYWGKFEQIFPSHPIFTMPLCLATILFTQKFIETNKKHNIFLASLFFSLAIHAHPTSIILLPFLLVLTRKKIDIKTHITSLIILISPIIPSIIKNLTETKETTQKISSYIYKSTEIPSLEKIITFPKNIFIDGFNYWTVEYLKINQNISKTYEIIYSLLLITLLIIITKNQKKYLFSFFISTTILLLIRKETTYYMLDSLYLLFFLSAIYATSKSNKKSIKIISITAVALSISTNIYEYHLISSKKNGEFNLSYYPLIDIKSPWQHSEQHFFMTYPMIKSINQWICESPKSLHGTIGINILHTYAIDKNSMCPHISLEIAGHHQDGYIGIPKETQPFIETKISRSIGNINIYKIKKYYGNFEKTNPETMNYPPIDSSFHQNKELEFQIKINKNEYISITDYGYPWKTVNGKYLTSNSREIYNDASQSIYTCINCTEPIKIKINTIKENLIGIAVF